MPTTIPRRAPILLLATISVALVLVAAIHLYPHGDGDTYTATTTLSLAGKATALVVGDAGPVVKEFVEYLQGVEGFDINVNAVSPGEALGVLEELQATTEKLVLVFDGVWLTDNSGDAELRQLLLEAYSAGMFIVVLDGDTAQLLTLLNELGLYGMEPGRNPTHFGPYLVGVSYRERVGPQGPYRYLSTLMSASTKPGDLAEALVQWLNNDM